LNKAYSFFFSYEISKSGRLSSAIYHFEAHIMISLFSRYWTTGLEKI